MNTNTNLRKSIISFGFTALLAVTAATAQVAGSTGIDASGNFQQEVNACLSGRTQQDQETCLTEARNAQADKARGELQSSSNTQDNAMSRCEVFTNGEENAACQARVMRLGNSSGSVAGGGVIREVETVFVPAGQTSLTFEAQTDKPVVMVPVR